MKTVAVRGAAGAVVLLALGGAFAFRKLYDRPGETAFELVPADAYAIASLDLSPGPSQTLAFKRISDALDRNDAGEYAHESFLHLFDKSPEFAPLAKLTGRSAAMFVMPSPETGKATDVGGAGFFGLTDPGAAEEFLKSHGKPEFWRGTKFFRVQHELGMMVIGNNLVISPYPWALHVVDQVKRGEKPAISTVADYAAARNRAAADANLLVMVSPKAFAEAQKNGLAMGQDWMTASIAVRDEGLDFKVTGRVDPTKDEKLAIYSQIKPIRSDLYRVLPPDAYAVVAVGQPAKYYEATVASAKQETVARGLRDMEASFAKSTGMSLKDDVLPGLEGNAIIAAYPSVSPTAGVDLLVVLDDQNGADPAAMADKFQAFVDREAQKQPDAKGSAWFKQESIAGARVFEIAGKPHDELAKGMKVDSPEIRGDVLTNKKTVAWAMVGKAMMMASNRELLDKAIASYNGNGSSLGSDPAVKVELAGDQTLAVFSLARIADGIRNTMSPSKLNEPSNAKMRQVFEAFSGLKVPLSLRGATGTDGRYVGSLFIPMDWDKTINLMKN